LCFTGFHRVSQIGDNLMDVIASGAFECSDIEAGGAGRDACQHGSCLAGGARWLQDNHDARLGSGGSVTELSVTGRRRYRADDGAIMPRRKISQLSCFAHFYKEINDWFTNWSAVGFKLSKIKLGHCENQIRPLGVETGHLRKRIDAGGSEREN
jgi:hypothetical protein